MFKMFNIFRGKHISNEPAAGSQQPVKANWQDLPREIILIILGLVQNKSKACQAALLLGFDPELINDKICRLQTLKANSAIENGYAELLKLLIDRQGDRVKMAQHSLNTACANGFVHILDLCTKSKTNMQFAPQAMDIASKHGQIGVLQWFFDNRYLRRLKYSPDSVEKALLASRFDVFDWWVDHGLTHNSEPFWIESALKGGNFDAANKWIACPNLRRPKYNAGILHFAAINDRIDILNWFSENNFPLEIFSETPCLCNSRKVLEWLHRHDLLSRCHPTVLAVLLPRAPAIAQQFFKKHNLETSTVHEASYWRCLNFDVKTKSSKQSPGCVTFYH